MRAREAAVQVGRDHALARSERAVVRNRGGTKKEILLYAKKINVQVEPCSLALVKISV